MNGSLLKPLNRYLNGSDETKPWGFNLFSVNLTEYQSLYIKKKKKQLVKILNQDHIWNNKACNDNTKYLFCVLGSPL